jgi:hypothetical protein
MAPARPPCLRPCGGGGADVIIKLLIRYEHCQNYYTPSGKFAYPWGPCPLWPQLSSAYELTPVQGAYYTQGL